MICVVQGPAEYRASPAVDGWSAFADTQRSTNLVVGYVSQPAHASLAGQIASALDGRIFGELPKEVIEIIARHDVGWADLDLPALEQVSGKRPDSFLTVSPRSAIASWERSIAAAEKVSSLAFYLTGKHFNMLAPRDEDVDHQAFIQKYGVRLDSESVSGYSVSDLRRFVAALGFCDLLSLHLCSGSRRPVRIPLAHPADPIAPEAQQVVITATGADVIVDLRGAWKEMEIAVGGWLRGAENQLSATTYQWTLGYQLADSQDHSVGS